MVIRSVPVTGRYRITGRAHRPVGYLSVRDPDDDGDVSVHGEGVGLEELGRLSYTRRYISLVADSARGWGMFR